VPNYTGRLLSDLTHLKRITVKIVFQYEHASLSCFGVSYKENIVLTPVFFRRSVVLVVVVEELSRRAAQRPEKLGHRRVGRRRVL
jgi:hypothetical protein